MLSLLQQIKMTDDKGYAQTVLTYILNTGEVSSKQTFSQMISEELSPEAEAIIMTPAQYFREEGFEKGVVQGIEQGIDKGVKKGRNEEKKN